MDSQLSAYYDRLLKEKDKRLRDKNQEINYYRNLVWELTAGDCEGHDPELPEAVEVRQEEPCGKMVIDPLVASILKGE